jgi:hypothetical protein
VNLSEYISIRIHEELNKSRSPMSLGRVDAFKEIARLTEDMQIEVEEDE